MATNPEEEDGAETRAERIAVTVRSTLGLTSKTSFRMWLALVLLAAIAVSNPIVPLAVVAVVCTAVLAFDLGKLR